ncbi:peptidase S8/S53 domain-containing protein [Sparassis latifolia]
MSALLTAFFEVMAMLLCSYHFVAPLRFKHSISSNLGPFHQRLTVARPGNPSSPLDTVLDLRLALMQSIPTDLEQALYDVSTPPSANYRKYLTKEAAEFVSPAAESLAAVNNWLQANNIDATVLTPASDWIGFSIPVSQENDLFDSEFSTFVHSASGARSIRTLAYSIPWELHGHLDFVHPTITFVVATLRHSSPYCVYQVDSVCEETLDKAQSNQLAVTGFNNQYANLDDLASTTAFSLQTFDGGANEQTPGSAGGEADLDIRYTVGLATDVSITFLSVGLQNSDGLASFLDVVNYFLSADTPRQLGARGVSLLFSSGDGGVAGVKFGGEDCYDFLPTFPSGCPYVTSVGATQGVGPEPAARYSSGDFSNTFPTPSYQITATAGYVQGLGSTYSGLYNPPGCGFPDVSAQGTNFQIVQNGEIDGEEGTSAASPTFASVIALLNNELELAGHRPLCLLNPWLYGSAASALNAITTGSNPGCGTNGFLLSRGLRLAGIRCVTGIGMPDYAKLRTAAGL